MLSKKDKHGLVVADGELDKEEEVFSRNLWGKELFCTKKCKIDVANDINNKVVSEENPLVAALDKVSRQI